MFRQKYRAIKLLGSLLLLVIVSFAVSCSNSSAPNYQPNTYQTVSTPTPTRVLVHQASNLVNGTITVKAGTWYATSFTVINQLNVRVSGSFRASGGSGNDIVALILDDIAYTNWSNGHQVSAIYNSGQLTVANINVSISPSGITNAGRLFVT